ncbi:hypothetical protein [Microbacterium sp. SORGH_AS_0862]|uniref:hypothetical protein n=1 Tax=Microbacterium sp. SORGH_AS_0862 TaxID=3041789 RepID=UPI00279128D6|nr:hypothetical protein [Microbacterium sp. SORGH_AS_0862]MDQ1204773.1 hypothetical protein [Microbacterium sp. SORGH_AS_0862]
MTAVAVSYVQLSQASTLLQRQRAHTDQMATYLESHCRLTAGDLGLVLRVMQPITDLITDAGALAIRTVGQVSDWAAETATRTLDDYVRSDQEAYEAARALLASLGGGSLPPFSDPRGSIPALGGPTGSADAGYGNDPSEYNGLADAIVTSGNVLGSGYDLISGTVETAVDRLSTLTSRGGVEERTDPTSYLVTPSSDVNMMEDLRWKAGLILGSVDYVAELILGFSILQEYVYKPLAGDWKRIDGASQAWTHEGRAMMELASNFSGLPGQMDQWEGEASLRFGATAGLVSGGAVGLSYAFDAISGLIDKVALASNLAASGIGAALQWIANKLTRLLIESSIPVAGWIVAGVEIIEGMQKVMFYLRLINTLITAILDAISDMVAGREKLVQAAAIVEDLANAAVTKAVR